MTETHDESGRRYKPLKWVGPLLLDGSWYIPLRRDDGSVEPQRLGRISTMAQTLRQHVKPGRPEVLLAPLLARTWARASVTAAEEYREIGESIPTINFAVEKMDAQQSDLILALQRWYAQGHFVVLALLHMEEWYARAGGRQQGLDVRSLRHSLEHLIEAELKWDSAVPDRHLNRKRWSIDDLPDGSVPLHFDLHMIDSIFGLVDLDAVMERATAVYMDMERSQFAGDAFFRRSPPCP